MKIKVLHIVGTMNRGGAEVMLMDIHRNISDKFHFDFLINYRSQSGKPNGDFDQEIISKDSKLIYIQAQWDQGVLNYIRSFKKIIQEFGLPDIVQIHLNAKSGVVAMAAKKAGIKKVIVHSHAALRIRGSIMYIILARMELIFQKILISRYSDYFFGCSAEANESLFFKKLLKTSKTTIINNAIDVNSFSSVSEVEILELRKKWGASPQTIIFGNVGRVVAHKNILFLLDVLSLYKQFNDDFLLVIAGRIEDQKYLQLFLEKAGRHSLVDKIRILGIRADTQLIYRSFDIFLGPALNEGFGMVAVEAQAAALPAILSGGFPQTVDMGIGLVRFISDFEAKKWVDAILDIELRSLDFDLIKAKISLKGFDINTNVKEIEKIYEAIIKN